MNTNTKELNINEMETVNGGILPVLIFGGIAVEAGVLGYVIYESL